MRAVQVGDLQGSKVMRGEQLVFEIYTEGLKRYSGSSVAGFKFRVFELLGQMFSLHVRLGTFNEAWPSYGLEELKLPGAKLRALAEARLEQLLKHWSVLAIQQGIRDQ